MPRIGLLTLYLLATAGCAATLPGTSTEIYWAAPRPEPHKPDCPLEILPVGPPPSPHQDIGYARTSCAAYDRDTCFGDLKRAACVAGADTVYGLGESVAGRLTYLTATFSRRPPN